MARLSFGLSRRIGRFRGDRTTMLALALLSAGYGGRVWLDAHPEHDPWAPLDLRDPEGWATATKLAALHRDPAACRAVLARSDVAFTTLPAAGEGACRREDRTVLGAFPLAPARPPMTCSVAAALELWRGALDQEAERILGTTIARVEHFGAYSCRRLYGRSEGKWSEHATGNAIDVAAFVLADGRRVSVLKDWRGEGEKARFLHAARDAACRRFGITLSPDYNAAHADHLHLDMGARPGGLCR